MATLTIILAISATLIYGKEELKPDTKSSPPNILFIMADDLGWGNVAWKGHNEENDEIDTPHMDHLVENGLLLNRHYVDNGCSPTRASFQTGRVPLHVTTDNGDGLLDPTHGIPVHMTTIASKLKEAGYGTHLVGKWDCGFSSYSKIPTNKGYDTFFGYLSKSITYFTKLADNNCDQVPFVDLWENGAPAYASMDNIDADEYIEFTFMDRVQTLITEYGSSSDSAPFFIMYSMHLVHYPSEVPQAFLHSFENDENMCSIKNDYVYPGFEDPALFECRSILQSQVHLMDHIIGQIIATLKANDLYDNTLIVFSSDNGGALELTNTAGNNYPLRGGKASLWEGGIRAASFVSGGYLPASRRGEIESGLMHIADWFATFCGLAGVDAYDDIAAAHELPNVDSVDMWPLLSGTIADSPRKVVPIGPYAVIKGKYKLMALPELSWAVWQKPVFPDSDTATQLELKYTVEECDDACLYDVVNDPTESTELTLTHAGIKEKLLEKLEKITDTAYTQTSSSEDSCPDWLDEDVLCGCWIAENNFNYFLGPYQDLTDDQKNFDESVTDEQFVVEVRKESNGREWSREMQQSNYYVYLSVFSVLFIGFIGFVKCCNWICGDKIAKDPNDIQTSYGTNL